MNDTTHGGFIYLCLFDLLDCAWSYNLNKYILVLLLLLTINRKMAEELLIDAKQVLITKSSRLDVTVLLRYRNKDLHSKHERQRYFLLYSAATELSKSNNSPTISTSLYKEFVIVRIYHKTCSPEVLLII